MTDTTNTLWNTREVALYLNVKESTIRHWVHIRFIPHIKFCGAVRFRRSDIVDWLNSRAANSTAAVDRASRRILQPR